MLSVKKDSELIGAPVLAGHMMPYVKKNCKQCHGRGKQRYVKEGGAENETISDVCNCARRRFLRERSADLVVVPDGRLFYSTAPGAMMEHPGLTPIQGEERAEENSGVEERLRVLLVKMRDLESERADIDARYRRKEEEPDEKLHTYDESFNTLLEKKATLFEIESNTHHHRENLLLQLDELRKATAVVEKQLEGLSKEKELLYLSIEDARKVRAPLQEKWENAQRATAKACRPVENHIASLQKRIDRLVAAHGITPERFSQLKVLSQYASAPVTDVQENAAETLIDSISGAV